jgi:hypothetical protein
MIYQNCIGSIAHYDSKVFLLTLGKGSYFMNIGQFITARRILNSVDIEKMLLDASEHSDFFTLTVCNLTGNIKLSIYELIQAIDLFNGTFYILELEDYLSRLDITLSEKEEESFSELELV